MPPTYRRLLALVLAGSLALAACSDGDASTTVRDDVATDDTSTAGTSTDDADDATGTTTTGVVPATGEPVPSAGCGTSSMGAVHQERRILDVAGTERWYLLTTPAKHDGTTPLPLVVDFHGLAEGAEIHAGMTGYAELAEAEGFVAAFPHGTGEPVRWNISQEGAAPNGDLAFVTALLDTLEADLCLDTSRVYATGLSNGAMMSSLVGCVMADRFAAVAPIAGLEDPQPCTPGRPVPMLTEHGGADPILVFNGGVGAIPGLLGNVDPDAPPTSLPPPDLDGPGYPARAAAWAARNGCEGFTDTTLEGTTDEVIHRVWDCPPGADVELYVVPAGGHSWPGSEFSQGIADIVGYTTFDLDASALGWEFFQRFTLPTP